MDRRYSILVLAFSLGACDADMDYASRCDGCERAGLALGAGVLVMSRDDGVTVTPVDGERLGTPTKITLDAHGCGSPAVSASGVCFSCAEGADRGSWTCGLDGSGCERWRDEPGRAAALEHGGETLLAWVGRQGEVPVARLFARRGGEWVDLLGPEPAASAEETVGQLLDLEADGPVARMVWLGPGGGVVRLVEVSGGVASDSRSWVSVDRAALASPMLVDGELVVTVRGKVDEIRALPAPEPGRVAVPEDGRLLARGDGTHPGVIGLASSGKKALLGLLRPDGAELVVDGRRVGFTVGRPAVAALAEHAGQLHVAWREGSRPASHFEPVEPDGVVVRRVE